MVISCETNLKVIQKWKTLLRSAATVRYKLEKTPFPTAYEIFHSEMEFNNTKLALQQNPGNTDFSLALKNPSRFYTTVKFSYANVHVLVNIAHLA